MLKKSSALKKTDVKSHSKEEASGSYPKKNIGQLIIVTAFVFGVAVVGIAAYFVNDLLVVKKQNKRLEQLTAQHAENIAQLISRSHRTLRKELEFYAIKVALEEAIANADKPALDVIKKQIINNVKNIKAIQFFRQGEAKRDSAASPPIRFSELALINQAEIRANPKPEVSSIEGEQYYNIVFSIPVDNTRPLTGTMLVRSSLTDIENILSKYSDELGRMTFIQRLESIGESELFKVGDGDKKFIQKALVPNSYFAVTIEPSDNLKEQSKTNPLIIYICLGIFGALFLAFTTISARKLAKKYMARSVEDPVKNDSKDMSSASLLDDVDGLRAVLEVELTQADEALLGLEDEPLDTSDTPIVALEEDESTREENERKLPSHIFRAYDIRGLAKVEITKEIAQQIGQAIGSEVLYTGETSIMVARDARTHSPELTEFLIRGILSSGCNVINLGTVPTPLLYYATHTLDASNSGVMVTASHNPAEYNGFKLIIDGKVRAEEDLKAIRSRILTNNFSHGSADETRHDIVTPYIDAIFSDVALAGEISMVIDAANGVSGIIAPKLFEELGCQVTPLFCDLDGTFPNHDPDPSIEANLQALITRVKETRADLGLAFDGDGDRVVVVTSKGQIIWPDRLLMLFAKDIVSRNPGADVVFDVKSTRMLNSCVTEYGGRPILWKTGHSHMKQKMQETGAILGGEYSGHIFIKDRWFGFDDGLYAAARLIEIMSLQGESLDTIISEFPDMVSTPEIRIAVSEDKKFTLVERLVAEGDFGDAKLTTIDGLRADFQKGWGLARASNTSADITLRFEAETEKDLLVIKSLFVRELKKIDSTINLNWE